jgi:uncharacterized protein YjbI with pentapeptide repeats
LRATNFRRSNLGQASFRGANLDESDLTDAGLSGADLTYASFADADLTNADLHDLHWEHIANLRNASIFGVKNARQGFGMGDQTPRNGRTPERENRVNVW